MVVKIKPGMTLIDAAVASGSLEALFSMAALNGLSITDHVAVGAELKTTGLKYKPSTLPVVVAVTSRPVMILAGQTLPDIAVQQLGSLEAWFELARLNGMSITDALITGSSLAYGALPYDSDTAKVFADKGYKPASGETQGGKAVPVEPEGIGYWIIGKNFKVS